MRQSHPQRLRGNLCRSAGCCCCILLPPVNKATTLLLVIYGLELRVFFVWLLKLHFTSQPAPLPLQPPHHRRTGGMCWGEWVGGCSVMEKRFPSSMEHMTLYGDTVFIVGINSILNHPESIIIQTKTNKQTNKKETHPRAHTHTRARAHARVPQRRSSVVCNFFSSVVSP